MLASRLAWTVTCLFALAAPGAKDELAFHVTAGTTLLRTLHTKSLLTLDEMHLSMNGEEVESGLLGAFEMRMQHERAQILRDSFETVTAERPTRVRRTFEELSGSDHDSYKNDEGAQNDDSELESALEKKSVIFSWSADSARYEAAFAEGQEGDDELLADLSEDLDFSAFLPAHAVAEGDTWELDAKAFQAILEPGGDVALLDPAKKDEPDDDSSAADQQLRDNLTGTIRATYKGVSSEGGVRTARIELAVESHSFTENATSAEQLGEDATGTDRAEPSFVLSGELRWDLEHGHAVALELSGDNHLLLKQTVTSTLEGERIEQGQSMSFAGEFSFSLGVERR